MAIIATNGASALFDFVLRKVNFLLIGEMLTASFILRNSSGF